MATPVETPDVDLKLSTERQVQKARMLVSMLGADFAKSSRHPFFRDLAQTAIQPVSDEKLSKPEMSRALQRLVRHLAEPRPQPKVEPRQEVRAEEPVAEDSKLPSQTEDMLNQHPVLIAKHLLTLPADERIAVLRSLPGRTARMVASYSAELENEA